MIPLSLRRRRLFFFFFFSSWLCIENHAEQQFPSPIFPRNSESTRLKIKEDAGNKACKRHRTKAQLDKEEEKR
jgi:hypothetical protein